MYERRFDYDEARRRVEAGETMKAVAKDLGVSPSAISRIFRKPVEGMRESNAGERAELFGAWRHRRDVDRCPTCHGPKTQKARLCATCHRDSRLGVPKLVRVRGQGPTTLARVENGRIVCYRGSDAVVESHGPDERYRELHYWDGPAEVVSSQIVVTVRPSWRVEVEDAA